MNILWDFRLFSYGYGSRGVGVYTTAMADAIELEKGDQRIFIWGERNRVPRRFCSNSGLWIEYIPRSWKSDLFIIPWLIAKYHIDIIHYWIAMGPLFHMGLGLFHPCKTCLTVHDCGVELWDKAPMCAAAKKTLYWKIQKLLFPFASKIVCNSHTTRREVEKLFKGASEKTVVMYPPIHPVRENKKQKRKKYFITLDGDAHKNTSAVFRAFQFFRQSNPTYSLFVLGGTNTHTKDLLGVTCEDMQQYPEHLKNAAGLIVCSFYEGLGLPVLEAMERGCPMVVSDIPAFRETCGNAAVFVDPNHVESINQGLKRCALNDEEWSRKSSNGALQYEKMCGNPGEKWIDVYRDLMRSGRRGIIA
jgi:glycosyltransferase involved in cell wall biosynthesis